MSPAIFIIIVYSIAKINIGFEINFKSDVFIWDKFRTQTHPLSHSVSSNLFLHNTFL